MNIFIDVNRIWTKLLNVDVKTKNFWTSRKVE